MNVRRLCLLFILILVVNSNVDAQTFQDGSMSFVASLDRDTASMGDTIHIKLRFQNRTDSVKMFYPGGTITISDKSKNDIVEVFGGWGRDFIILSVGKVANVQRLDPGSVYEIDYPLIISSPFFVEGNNRLNLRYSLKVSKDYKGKDIFNGTFYANEVLLYVDRF